MAGNKRAPYDSWSDEEESVLLHFVDKHYDVLYGTAKSRGANFKHEKDQKWKELATVIYKVRGARN